MRLSKKLKKQIKTKLIIPLATVSVIMVAMVICKLADFSMPAEKINFLSKGNEFNIASTQTKVTISEDGAIVCDSIVQGIRDCNLVDGNYIFRVNGNINGVSEQKDYAVELINYYDNITYSLRDGETERTISLGDNTTDYKMLVVKYHKNLTIEDGVTVTATNVEELTYKKGMYLCVMGELNNKGTISMTARGTYNQEGENVYLWKNIDDTFEYVPAVGGAGGLGKSSGRNDGNNGINRATGGGGSGASIGTNPKRGGNGATGTSYSGGSGGGGVYNTTRPGSYTGGDAEPNGGKGGYGAARADSSYNYASGGAGNIAGKGAYVSSADQYANAETQAENGTGGLLVVYSDKIYNTGTISSNGSNVLGKRYGTESRYSGGGASGGGSVNIFADVISTNENIVANPGISSVDSSGITHTACGANGGSGSVTIKKGEYKLNYANKYLKIGDKINSEIVNAIKNEYLDVKEFVWTSSNEDVATIDENGVITGKRIGHTTITAYNEEKGLKLKAIINVYRDKEGAITVPQVEEGEGFTALLKEDGTVWTSGYNGDGQLGNGTTTNSNIPVQVKIDENTYLTNVRKISLSYAHTIAVTTTGEVYTWGYNKKGQLGVGDLTNRLYATKVEDLNGIIDVTAGVWNSYAINSNGNIYGWGSGKYYEINNSKDTDYYFPVHMPQYSNVITASSGDNDLILMQDNSEVWVRGYNGYGQLGNGKVENYNSITDMIGTDINEIKLSTYNGAIIKEDGTVWTTGRNINGQLGVGDKTDRSEYTQVKLENGEEIKAKYIKNGINNLIIIGKDGKVYVAGYNGYGQLCDGTTKDSAYPIIVKNADGTEITDAILINASGNISNGKNQTSTRNIVVVKEDGSVWISGDNTYGQIGNGTNTSTNYLTRFGIDEVSLNARNEYIKIGESIDLDVITTLGLNVLIQDAVNQDKWTWTSSNEDVATINENGIVTGKGIGHTTITGYNKDNELKVKAIINVYRDKEGAITVPQVEQGEDFTVVLKEDGTVWTSGRNNYGQLGNGTTTDSNIPVQVKIDENTYLTNVRKISSGCSHVIALTIDGEVYGWGKNDSGQLAQGNQVNQVYAKKLKISEQTYIKNTIDIASGDIHSMILDKNGKIYVVGSNYWYQNLTTGREMQVTYLKETKISNAIKMTAGYSNCGAMISNGDTLAWGHNYAGALETRPNPTLEYIISKDVIDMQLNGYSTILQKENGSLFVTGRNNLGQLGLGDTADRNILTQLLKDENGNTEEIKYIGGSSSNTLLLTKTGKLYATGYNGYGQLCDGTTTNALYPINIKNQNGIELTDVMLLAGGGNCNSSNGFKNLGIIRKDGTVWISGDNTYGQMGNETNTSTNYLTKFGIDEVKANVRNEYIKIDESIDINVADAFGFNVFIQDVANKDKWTWSSSNEDVATINENGVVTGKGVGHTTITGCDLHSGLKVKAIINVYRNKQGAITVPQVEEGEGFTTLLKEDGTVWTSGKNNVGQLGDGTLVNRNIPVQVKIDDETYLTNVRKISSAHSHTIALTVDGEVWAWGSNANGKLGLGDTTNRLYANKVKGINGNEYLKNIIDISISHDSAHAVNNNGDLLGWGYGDLYTLLGNKTTYTPVKLNSIRNVISINAGYNDVGVILSNGETWIWGENKYGSLGNGTTSLSKETNIGNDITEINLEGYSGYILKEDKTVWSSGLNDSGQLGVGDTIGKTTYTKVKLENNKEIKAKTIKAGGANLQFIGEDGKVYVTGNNEYGRLCDGTTTNAPYPIVMKNQDGTEVTDCMLLIPSYRHYQSNSRNLGIIRKDGTIWFAGDNTYGQMGNGNNVSTNYLTKMGDGFLNYPEKTIILGVNEYKNIELDKFNLEEDINVFIDEKLKFENLQFVVEDDSIAQIDENNTIKGISQGVTKIKITDDKTLLSTYIWVKVTDNKNIKVSLGNKFSVALKQDGTVWSWGQNKYGELGLGNNTSYNEPQKIIGITEKIIDVKTGYYHSIALTEDGNVYTWGDNRYGQLGNGNNQNSLSPIKVQGLENISKVDSYKYMTIALNKDGEVYVWGNGYDSTPKKLNLNRKVIDIAGNIVLEENRRAYDLKENVSYGKDLIKISAGENHYLGLASDGEVFAWGANNYGQLGNGNNVSSNVPTKVVTPDGKSNINNIFEISAGNNYSVISDKDGNVYTFGDNKYSKLGIGGTRNRPIKVDGLNKIELLAASEGSHTAVADWNGYVHTIGLNDLGQLGLRDNNSRDIFNTIGEIQIQCNKDKITMHVGDTEDINLELESSFNLKFTKEDYTQMNKSIVNESVASILDNTITANSIGKTILNVTCQDIKNTDVNTYFKNIEIEVLPESGIAVPKVEAGNGFTISLKSDGTVWSWGQNQYGQLGLGNNYSYSEPQKISITKDTITNEEEKIKDIAVGNYQVLALGETGKVYSWGLGNCGQLGIGNTKNQNTPVVVKDIYGIELKDIVKIEAGENVSFAINAKGEAYAWGDGYTPRAQKLETTDNIVDVTSKYVLTGDGKVYNIISKERLQIEDRIIELDEGTNHIVMLTSQAKAYAIGDNTYGQLSNGNNTSSTEIPVAVKINNDKIFTNIKEIKAGDRYTIIVTNDGKVYTVGKNENNELGIENTINSYKNLPEINTNIDNVIFSVAGYNHVTVVKQDGVVYSWGNGELGQLGNRDNKNSILPVIVGDYIIRTNTNKIVLGVNSEKIIQGYVDYFNIFNNDIKNITYISKDYNIANLIELQPQETEQGKIGIKVVGKNVGTTIVTANQDNTENINVIQVEVIPETKEIEPMVLTNGSHTITLRTDGKVFTYGDNTYGQLGNRTNVSSDEPVEVSFPRGAKITQIAIGENHNVALDSEGAVWTWGRNNNYQIGNSSENQNTPYKVVGLPKIIRVATGNNSTMVITENNELYAWGLNSYGNLGLGNYTNKVLPTKVEGIKDIIDISGGRSHFIALSRTGEIYSSGYNTYGQLGIGTNEINKINKFTKIDTSEKIGTISAGDLSNIATSIDGNVYVWGANTNGQLGTGDTNNRNSPIKIDNVQDIRQASTGKMHTVICDGNNNIFVTGKNTYGELGIGTNDNKTTFEQNKEISDVLRISAGNTYTTFLKKDGYVWACGDYNHGDKTKKSRTNSKIPVIVGSDTSSLENLEIILMKDETKSIIANAKYKFNLIYIEENNTSDFKYSSYNNNIATIDEKGIVLGIKEGTTWVKVIDQNTGKEHIAIVRVIENNKENKLHVAPKVLSGENFAIGLKQDGTVWTWGYDESGLVETNIPTNSNVLSTYKDIDAGKNYALAVRENGTVWSIGNNKKGQLGIGTTDNKSKLVQMEGLSDIVQISAGEDHGIAIDSFGIIYGFGTNSAGQLGNEYIGKNTNSPVIITIPNERILQVSAGKEQSAFVTANGTIYGMGKILNGYIPNIQNAVKVDVGDNYILILRNDGSIYKYQYEKLTRVSNVSNAIDISVQNKVNMYQSIDEKAYIWGMNPYGQLGINSTTSSSTPKEPTKNSTNVFRIGAGYNNTYIIANDGFVYSAGNNTYGELGNGTNTNNESTTKELSLVHTLVGDRNFIIKPESNTLEINETEDLDIEPQNIFNVFNNSIRNSDEYGWKSEDDTVLTVLEDGKIQGINTGTTNVTATDKITNDTKKAIRAVVPVDTDRIESITANGKEAVVTGIYQYQVKVPISDLETTTKVVIKTKLDKDSISIDNGLTWTKGIINTTIDITDKLTTIPFIVKTEAGNEINYNLTLIRQSNNNKIANITLTTEAGEERIANKVSDRVYEVIAPVEGINSIKVTADNEKSFVSIKGIEKTVKEQIYNLTMTNQVEEIPIRVTSESEDTENYTLIVYREDNVATLDKVTVNGINATKVNDTQYEITIKDDINQSEITAITNLSTAKVGINNNTKQVNKVTQNIQTTEDRTIVTIEVEEPQILVSKIYKLTIRKERDISDDLAIKNISINELLGNDNINATVSEANDIYEVYMQNPVQKIKVVATTKDPNSKIKIAGNNYALGQDTKDIQIDSNLTELIISVQSETGIEKNYTLNIHTLSDNTNLQQITVGNVNAIYNNDLRRYEARVNKQLTQYDITAISQDANANVTIDNNTSLGTANKIINKAGEETEVLIKVMSPNGLSEEIHKLVIMEKSNNANIDIVQVNGIEIKSQEDGNYIANITASEEETKIFVEAQNEYAKVTVDSETENKNTVLISRNITDRTIIYNIEVLSEDGETTVNKLLTINKLNNNTDIEEVSIKTLNNSIYKATLQEDNIYYCKIPRQEVADVTVTLDDEKASVAVNNGTIRNKISTETVTLLDEITQINAQVQAEDGTQREIIIKIEKQSNDISLLEITSPSIKKVSKMGASKYEIQIDDRLEKIVIDAITTNENAQIKLGTETEYSKHIIKDKEINVNGETSFTIDVLAEDGVTTRTYTIQIMKVFNTDLENIITDSQKAIKIDNNTYNGWVNSDDIANIEIIPENILATVSVYKDENLIKQGIGILTFTEDMTAEKATYKIVVNGPNSESSEYILNLDKKSANNNIEYVKVNGETLTENEETGKYELEVGTVNDDKYKLEVKAQDDNATVKLDDGQYSNTNKVTEEYIINPDETKEIYVTVKSQDGDEITKVVSIYRKDDNVEIEYVKVNNKDTEKINNTTYRTSINSSALQSTIDIKASSQRATIKVLEQEKTGNPLNFVQSLTQNTTKIKFAVTAKSGEEKEYTLEIIKEQSLNVIKNVYVDDIEIQKDVTTGRYKAKVNEENLNPVVKVITNDKLAYIAIGTSKEEQGQKQEKITLDNTKITEIPITIRNQKGETVVEYLDIEKIYVQSKIDTLIVDNKEITYYDEETKTYTAFVDSNIDEHEIFVTSTNTYATLQINNDTGIGNVSTFAKIPVEDLEKQLTLNVTSQSEGTQKYIIKLVKKSNNVKLLQVMVNDATVSPEQNNTDIYKKSIKKLDDKVKVKIITEYPYANVKIADCKEDIGVSEQLVNLNLSEDIITIPVVVTATDGETIATYNIILTRSSNNTNIAVSHDENILTKDKNGIYKANVLGGTTTAKVTIKAEDEKAKIEIGEYSNLGTLNANLKLNNIENTFIIKTTAEDGTEEENPLKITKQTNIEGKVLTENAQGEHKSLVTLYKTDDKRKEDDKTNPREIIKQIETNIDGTFVLELTDIERYDILVTKLGYVDYRITNIEVEKGEKITLNEHKILAGDVVKTGQIEIDDLVALNDNIGQQITDENREEKLIYDLNEDGNIDSLDRDILKKNYGEKVKIKIWEDQMPVALMNRTSKTRRRRKEDEDEGEENLDGIVAETEIEIEEAIIQEQLVLPVKCSYTITSKYGTRVHPVTKVVKKHTGIDLRVAHHTEILSIADGEVTFSGVQKGFGNCIEIKHIVNGETIYSFYAHLSRIDVQKGQRVKQSEVIGLEGGDPNSDPNPGSSTGHHLHFEIRNASGYKNDVDPSNYIDF